MTTDTRWLARGLIWGLLMAAMALLLSTPAHAQSLKLPLWTYAGAAGADMGSTAYCLKHPVCVESNPGISWAQRYGDGGMLAIGGALDTLGVYTAYRLGHKNHPKLLTGLLYTVAGVRIGITIHNIRLGHRLRRETPIVGVK